MFNIFIILFLIFTFALVFISKKKNFFLDMKNEKHKKYSSNSKSYFLGGIFLITYFTYELLYLSRDFFLITLLSLIFIIGLLSDLKKLNSVSLRFFLQLILMFFFIQLIGLEINNTKIPFIDQMLQNNYVNMFFVLFCLSILINGSNFIDGINGLLLGYYLVLFSIIFFKFDESFQIDLEFILMLILILAIILAFNTAGYIYMGDSGAYLLSLFTGIYLIKFSFFNNYISPYIVVVMLWYPCFELLFSMIRRNLKKNKTYKPDTQHLHHLVFSLLKNSIRIKNNIIIHIITSTVINLFNLIILLIAINFIYSSEALILILVFNVLVYLLTYYFLMRMFKNIN